MSWAEARSSCQANAPQNGDLASVPDQATSDFLSTLTTEIAWIGGHWTEEDGWTWSDGTPWGFESWHPGEPNNWGGIPEDYIATNFGSAGEWNDFPMEGSTAHPVVGFICQYQGLYYTYCI